MPEGRMCFARMSFRRMSSTISITQCHPASLVIGFAVITRSGHHEVSSSFAGHRHRRYEVVIGFAVITRSVSSVLPFH